MFRIPYQQLSSFINLLTSIPKFNINGVTKFTRPVFGDGTVYIGTTLGALYGFGSPVNLPLNCSSPYDFGTVNIGESSIQKTVTCTAIVAVSISNITLSSSDFSISNVPNYPVNVAAHYSFTFQAVFSPSGVGRLSADVVLSTATIKGYSNTIPISLQGNGQSISPILAISPVTLAFPGLITGEQIGGANETVLFTNLGNNALTITSILYSIISETGPFIAPNTTLAGTSQIGPFTLFDLPTVIQGGQTISVTINFDTDESGNFAAFLNVVSDGGTKIFDIVGTSGDPPKALIEFQSPDGHSWITYVPDSGQNLTFGNVTENRTRSLKLRVTNNATANSARLSLTVSKPPFGDGGIINANNLVDLAEGTSLGPGENATAVTYCSVPKTQWDTDSYVGTAHWTMNFNDLTFVKQDIPFLCNAVAEQAYPLIHRGYARYRYIGCYKENNPGRQLKYQLYGSNNNTNPMCIAACAAKNYIFCGTQYNRECWGGPTIPVLQVSDTYCDYACSGDINQICGGNGVGATQGGAYISLFADSLQFTANMTAPNATAPSAQPPALSNAPVVNPGVSGWTSLGCFTEATTGRALPKRVSTSLETVGLCLAAGQGYRYCGLEYGGVRKPLALAYIQVTDDFIGMLVWERFQCRKYTYQYHGLHGRLQR